MVEKGRGMYDGTNGVDVGESCQFRLYQIAAAVT